MFVHRSDLSDEDLMVATIKSRVGFAFEDNCRVRKHRHAGIAGQWGNTFPFVAFGARELIGNLLLLLIEHVDGVAIDPLPHREAVRLAKHTEQDQRRIERHRIERTHGHPDELARGGSRGGDHHAGRKLPKGVAESAGIHAGLRTDNVIYTL